ncbi:MAG: heavy metal translocating P-type ATPase [Campylobacterales bacterium]
MAEQVKCDHCGLAFDASSMINETIDGKEYHFCCKGCQGVYHLLREEGLDGFYERRGETTLTPPIVGREDLERFDLESFKERFIRVHPDGLWEVSLILEGIHCAACVWLNEKVLSRTDGVIEASINFTTNKARIVWDPNIIKLSGIIEKIRSIGYNAYPYDARVQEAAVSQARRDYYYRMAVAIFATMNVMWIAIAQYAGYFQGIEADHKLVLTVAEFFLATPTLFYSGWIYFRGGWYGLRNGLINMDLLVATGATLAWIYSTWAMITGRGESYFESVTMIVTFVLVGKFLEVLARKSAVDTLDRLSAAIPSEVMVLRDGVRTAVAPESVAVGEEIEVRPGERIVLDGEVVAGESSVDESALTGESIPVFKSIGSRVSAGTQVIDGLLRIRVIKPFAESTLSVIIRLLEESLEKKPKIEELANRLSGRFSQVILTIALITFAGWYWWGGTPFEIALINAISVIIIACPCALALATPIATLVGLGRAARSGIIFRAAQYLETMAQAKIVLLDKTGTITEGKPVVVAYREFGEVPWSHLAVLVATSNHPVSVGLLRWLEERGVVCDDLKVELVKNRQARGVTALIGGKKVAGGNARLMEELGIAIPMEASEGRIAYYFAVEGEVVALFELEDRLKPGVAEAVAAMKKMGLRVILLTGDRQTVALRIAQEAGIEDVRAELLPQDKLAVVEEFQKQGDRVVMAGDGINDALALARADVGIAMGGGAELAVDVSDVVILNDAPQNLTEAFTVARRTYSFIKQNLLLSLIYNTLTIPLAVAGYVIPLIAAASMSLSSLLVVGNSMRINQGAKR